MTPREIVSELDRYIVGQKDAKRAVAIALRNRILKREPDSDQALADIHEMARSSGLDLDVARQLDPQTLLLWLAPGDDVDEPKLWLMAELLYLEGLHAQAAGEPGAGRADLTRALAVFGRLPAGWRPHADLPSAGERVDEIRESVAAAR
jgi:hypothetical protein